MKRIIQITLLLSFLIWPILMTAQTRVSVNLLPNYTQLSFSDKSQANSRLNHKARPSLCTGLVFETVLHQSNFSFQTGMEYLEAGNRLDLEDLRFGDQIDSRRGFIYESDFTGKLIQIDYSYRYLSVPVILRYSKGNNKWSWSAGMGLSVDKFIERVSIWKRESQPNYRSVSKNSSYAEVVLSWRADFRIARSFGEKIDVSAGPAYRRSFTPSVDSPSDFRLNNLGILIGFGLKL